MQLKKKLWNKPFCNDLHFFLIAGVIVCLSIRFPIFYVALGVYLIFIIKKTKYILPILCVILLIVAAHFLSKQRLKELATGLYEDVYQVVDVSNTSLMLKGETKIVVYYTEKDLKPGDIIEAKVKIKSLGQSSYAGDFDEKSYYEAKGITNRGTLVSYNIKGFVPRIETLRYYMIGFYEKHLQTKSLAYLKTIFFGISSLDTTTKEVYSSLYISHLLSISGLHIMFFYYALLCILQKIFKIRANVVSLGILSFYILLIGIPTPSLRAYLVLLFSALNKKGSIKYTRLDIFSLSFLIAVILYPLRVYQTGFILSYLISFLFLFINEFLSSTSKWMRSIITQFLCIGMIFPFLINQSYELSIIGIILASCIGLRLGKLLLVLVLFMLFVPCGFYEIIFFHFDNFLFALSKITYPIRFPYMSIPFILIYYLFFVVLLMALVKQRRRAFSFFIFAIYILAFLSLRFVDSSYRVTYIDVGQGDSICIELPFQKGIVLIDSFQDNTKYLLSRGIRRIDYILLTHFDQDHMGSIEAVVQTFDVGTIFYSAYENPSKISHLNVKQQAISANDYLYLGETVFEILGPVKQYSDSNSNSVVVKTRLGAYDFLFTGDMTQKEELDLIRKYGGKLSSDILKVGHHGSRTSSSEEFLNIVHPKVAIISVGKDNLYGLPDEEILKRLAYTKVYMTSENGNIDIIVRKKLYIRPFRE